MFKDQAKQETARFRILTEVSQQIISILDIDNLLEQVVQLLQQTFNYYHVGIGLIEDEDVVYRIGAGVLWDAPSFQFKPARLKVGMEGITGWVAGTGQAALVPDVTRDSRYVWMQGSETRSELTVPITVKGQTIGVLDVQSQQIDGFDQTDLELMQSLAGLTGIAIENARLFANVGRRAEQFRVLTEVSQHIISLTSVNELLENIARLVKESFYYLHVGIGLVESNEVVSKAEVGAFEGTYRGTSIPIGQGIWGWVAVHGQSHLSNQIHEIADYGRLSEAGVRSHVCVPLKVKDRVIGVISAASDRAGAFDESDEIILQTVANQASVAIENARLFAETQRLLKETEGRASKLAIINSIQQGLASKLDVQSIYDMVGDKFREIFDAQVVMISTYDPQSNSIEHRYAIERGERVYSPGAHPPGGFRSQIIQTRQPLLVNKNVAEEAARLGQPTLPGTVTPVSWLGVPMLAADQVIGILSVQNLERENAFEESDVRLLQTFAASMSIALENARLYDQARRLAVLEERQRLARELHDSVTQSLYGINLYVEAAAGQMALGQTEQVRQYLSDIQATAQESLAEMRLLIYELRPPILEREGLVATIQNRLYSVEHRAGLKFNLENNLKGRLSPALEEGLYRIANEALNNTLKHSHAKNVTIRIQQDGGSVVMEIADDGIGFEMGAAPREGCLGLVTMQERAQAQGWHFSVDSGPGNGTRIRVEVKR